MAQNDIDNVLDPLRRVDWNSFENDQIENLEMHLRFLRTFIKYHHVFFPDSLVKIKENVILIVEMLQEVRNKIPDECNTNLDLERLVSHLLEFIKSNTSLSYNYELNDSDLLEYMDCLGKNLNDVLMGLKRDSSDWIRVQLISDPSSTNVQILQYNQFLKQVKIIQKKMKFLKDLYSREINGYVDNEKLEGLETRIQFMAENVGQYCVAFWLSVTELEDDDIDDYKDDISNKPPYLFCLIVLAELEMKKIFLGELKASKFTQSKTFNNKKLPEGFSHHLHSLLMYLRDKNLENFPNNVSARNIDVAIEFLLIFLNADVPNHVTNGNWLNEVLEKVGIIAGDVLYVSQKLLPRSINKDDTSKINTSKINSYSIQILEKTEDLNAQVETNYKSLKFTPSQFPTVGGLSFLDSLLRKLNEMLNSKSGLDFLMKPHFGNLEKELSSLTSILEKELSSLSSIIRDAAKVHHEHEILNDLHRRIINLAYEAEVAIDSILAQYNVFWHTFCSLPTILKEIKHINVEMTEMWSADVALKPQYVIVPSKSLPTRHINPVNDEEIVGFENDTEKMIHHLTQGTCELDVVPIVGMGGQGKTTFARKLYNSDIIISHFPVRAWCIISQIYSRRELLQEIFSQVTGSKGKGDEEDILADKLRKSLMGKRYLIVLDDMWDVMAWDDLRLCFPDGRHRSRLVITTRLEEVAKQVKHHIDPYSLPFLTPAESLKLLQKKVIQQESCPPALQDVSLEIAEKCKGLPLVIILVAGIIKRNKMEASWWHKIKKSLLSYLGESKGYALSTMQFSYDNLPDHLKPCLLYMGMFPEDARIPVSKLISLWIAECFVQKCESGRLMDEVAEGYLMDLISSNVVMAPKREYNGKVKYCQVHDVVLHFCLEKSREEKFMLAVKGDFQPLDWNGIRVRFSFTDELFMVAPLGSKTQKPLHQHLRSLITTNQAESYDHPIRQVSGVRFLKVLDLSSVKSLVNRSNQVSEYFLSATLKPLVHLKYLAVDTSNFHFHPELHLPYLETLLVKCSNYPVLPAIFWEMEKLRHVDINNAKFDLEENKQRIFDESSKLENFRILREVRFGNADSVDVLLQRCPSLQELGITLCDNNYSAEPFSLKLESLAHLQILCLSFQWPIMLSNLNLPSSLKKLVLRGIPIDSVISFIAGLPNLECLQLQATDSFESKKWCLPEDITFHNLKVLKLVELGISRWDASEESFPLLETLVISWCGELEEIPLSFADILTLKQIKLSSVYRKSLEASAVKIKEDVKESEGNDRIDLIFKVSRNKLIYAVFEYLRASNVQTICSIQPRWLLRFF